MKKKLVSLCLAVILIFSILPVSTFAEDNTVTVASDADWVAFCENAEANQSATLQITADFHMGGVQFPLPFTGTVYGNGHTVTYGTDTAENWACALFSSFAGEAYDLILGNDNDKTDKLNANKTTTISGAFANEISGNAFLSGLVNKVYVVTAKPNWHVGGLVGVIKGNNSTVIFENCQNACVNSTGVVVKNANARGGGLVGVVTGTNVSVTFRNCANNGKVHTADTQPASLGGFVGYWESANGSLTFDRCVNNYEISKVKGPMAGFLGDGPDATENNTFALTFFKSANRGNLNGTAVLKNDTAILSTAAGFVNGTVAASIEFLGCSNTGSIELAYTVKSGYTGGATAIGGAGFAYDSKALAEGGMVISNCYTNTATTASNTTDDYTAAFGSFTVAGNDFTASNALDLTGDATLADVAKLENGTLFRADGSFVWEAAETLTTLYGASIRTQTPTGLRFSSTMSKEAYDRLTEQYTSVTVGTLIAPHAYVERVGSFTMEALDTLGYSVNYLKVPATPTVSGNTVSFNGSVANIREDHYQLEYVGRAYLLCVDAQGNETVIYADYEQSYAPRTVYYVATQALADPNHGLSAGALEAIETIVNRVNGAN